MAKPPPKAISSVRRLARPAIYSRRHHPGASSLPQCGPQVLGANLNRFESTRQPACPRLSLPLLALRERRHCVIARRGIAVRRRARYAAGGGGGGFGGLGGGGLGGLGGNMATRKVK